MTWVRERLESYAEQFCFVGVNFQREAKGKKSMYDPAHFVQPRTREFFRGYYQDWNSSDLFWWWKDRPYYDTWLDEQLDQTWQDVPDTFSGKYEYIEVNHR
jgi:hypothetical protein